MLRSEVDVMRAAMDAAAERVRDSLAAKESALAALESKASPLCDSTTMIGYSKKLVPKGNETATCEGAEGLLRLCQCCAGSSEHAAALDASHASSWRAL